MNEITGYRADGWPLCPRCGEDELWSQLVWNGEDERPPVADYIAAGLRCYRCHWSSFGMYSQDCARAMAGLPFLPLSKVPNIPPKDQP